jgi:Uma2 family endonuclease
MTTVQPVIITDTWIPATWEDYLRLTEDPAYAKAKGYYYHNHMRLEMLPVGFDHSTDHSVIALAVNLFGILKNIALTMADNCTYRKTGVRECQPDLSCYVGERARAIPTGTNIVNLDHYPTPNLAIEISKTPLLDDLGAKRSLYEEIGFDEYWVVNVEKAQIFAYRIFESGSQRIDTSQVLSGLSMAVLEEALQRSRQTDQSQVGAWLMAQFVQESIQSPREEWLL